MPILSEQTFNRVTKVLLAPVSPLQIFLDAPSPTHGYCLQQAYDILRQDGKDEVAAYFCSYDNDLQEGLSWADRGWKNICHYFYDPEKQGRVHWPGADAECQYYFNKAAAAFQRNISKGMFYLGAALHIVQDMCVPHHALGVIFDGHQEFERWTINNLDCFIVKGNGIYKSFTHPTQWIRYNAEIASRFFQLVSQENGCSEESYNAAAGKLLPLTVLTTAGFLDFAKPFLQRG
ncbi:Zinc dependent phospholipase C [Desulfosporosinus acidiphilus SJ4]|uniref:Phospholipase C n=1 Tax=Desulfosporosinus acidiphilus (strain DSM 22704 / JCM 16185 / SJ4) TaxID=646529 RepID=I4DB60_DESAJ|nr:zinc dependent phospholipase C family protein [Desulfosporosinus acidiphilus]AFM43034.1 Zinc dependent phospholipase C [Desulfosporosinus acidiphilus SJ4]